MLRRLALAGLAGGVAGGAVAAALQQALLVPLILEAETYEGAAASGGAARHLLSAAVTVLSMTGWALLLAAGFALAERAGAARIGAAAGLAWGAAGFAAVQLLPAIGLPPELPGAAAAALAGRQAWWAAAVAASAAGLALGWFGRGPWRLAGLALVLAPHLVGAPHPAGHGGTPPPELAALFAARALAVGAAAWLALGAAAGWMWARLGAGR